MFKGTRYRVTCEQLGATVWTKEGSASLANDWWRSKKAEISGPNPVERLVGNLTQDVARLKEDIERGMAARAILTAMPVTDPIQAADEIIGIGPLAPDDPRRLDYLSRLHAKLGGDPVPQDMTLGKQAERFLSVEQARGKAPGTYGDLAYYVRKLQADCPVLPATLDVRKITETTITDFYTWLRNESGQAPVVQRKLWNYFRRLVRFLWGVKLIDLPRNLDLRIFNFDVTARRIKTWPVAEVRDMLKGLPDRLKLYALLALNCGMYGVDMASLRHEEYKDGRIRRKRTKTRKGMDVPEVDYPLWPETKALLDKYPGTHPEYVLTSKTGTPLWRAQVVDGKTKKVDLVSLQWHRGRGEGRASKPPIPLKALRSVAATIIESHREYGRYKSHFLGHSPKSLGDKHYAAPSRELFDEIIFWLRSQIVPAQGR
jgi:integrase